MGAFHVDKLHMVNINIVRITASASDGLEWPNGHNGFYFEVETDHAVSDSLHRHSHHAVD